MGPRLVAPAAREVEDPGDARHRGAHGRIWIGTHHEHLGDVSAHRSLREKRVEQGDKVAHVLGGRPARLPGTQDTGTAGESPDGIGAHATVRAVGIMHDGERSGHRRDESDDVVCPDQRITRHRSRARWHGVGDLNATRDHGHRHHGRKPRVRGLGHALAGASRPIANDHVGWQVDDADMEVISEALRHADMLPGIRPTRRRLSTGSDTVAR